MLPVEAADRSGHGGVVERNSPELVRTVLELDHFGWKHRYPAPGHYVDVDADVGALDLDSARELSNHEGCERRHYSDVHDPSRLDATRSHVASSRSTDARSGSR
jgi:hypothetical protein